MQLKLDLIFWKVLVGIVLISFLIHGSNQIQLNRASSKILEGIKYTFNAVLKKFKYHKSIFLRLEFLSMLFALLELYNMAGSIYIQTHLAEIESNQELLSIRLKQKYFYEI